MIFEEDDDKNILLVIAFITCVCEFCTQKFHFST